ncbi:MAG: PadR family transcriptional regulator [Reichenbachiella sp.]
MKETKLGEFEEVVLLLVGILGASAYALKVAGEFQSQTGRTVSIGSVHSTMDRLSEKGFLSSEMGKPTAERGGRRKRIYTITASGQRALANSREFKLSLWNQFPGFAINKINFSFLTLSSLLG